MPAMHTADPWEFDNVQSGGDWVVFDPPEPWLHLIGQDIIVWIGDERHRRHVDRFDAASGRFMVSRLEDER